MSAHGRRRGASPPQPGQQHVRGRDADEEQLEWVIAESMQPDLIAEIVRGEEARRQEMQHDLRLFSLDVEENLVNALDQVDLDSSQDSLESSGEDVDVSDSMASGVNTQDEQVNEAEKQGIESEPSIFDSVAPDVLRDLLFLLDEDSIMNCSLLSKSWREFLQDDKIFEYLCRRIYTVQSRRATQFLRLKKWKSWFAMFKNRPRVRYSGFYVMRISYYKKPELNMWSDITPGTILESVYFRYLRFRRDGSVIYSMNFQPPKEFGKKLHLGKKDNVFCGHFSIEKDRLFVSVPQKKETVEFRLKIATRYRGHNTILVLEGHALRYTKNPNEIPLELEVKPTNNLAFKFHSRGDIYS